MNCRRHIRKHGRKQSGFTMVEIAIALGVIGFALVAIIGILPTGLEVQRDNRSETIINQDANFWMEALRSGAVDANELPGLVEWVELIDRSFDPAVTNRHWNQFHPDAVPPTFTTFSNIIGLLTWSAIGPDREVLARITAVSGAAGEKEMNQVERAKGIGFAYLLRVVIEPRRDVDAVNTNYVAIPFVAVEKAVGDPAAAVAADEVDKIQHFGYPDSTSLMEMRLAFLYPATQEGKPPPRAQNFRVAVNRRVVTNDAPSDVQIFLRP